TNKLSDQNRIARGKAPKIDPNGLKMPYSLGNTPLPEVAKGGPPTPPPSPPTPPPPKPSGTPSGGTSAPPTPKNEESKLQLSDIPTQPGADEHSQLRMPGTTPGEAIMQASRSVARGRASGAIGSGGDSDAQFNNLHSNF